jgi:hypothetical protein
VRDLGARRRVRSLDGRNCCLLGSDFCQRAARRWDGRRTRGDCFDLGISPVSYAGMGLGDYLSRRENGRVLGDRKSLGRLSADLQRWSPAQPVKQQKVKPQEQSAFGI